MTRGVKCQVYWIYNLTMWPTHPFKVRKNPCSCMWMLIHIPKQHLVKLNKHCVTPQESHALLYRAETTQNSFVLGGYLSIFHDN